MTLWLQELWSRNVGSRKIQGYFRRSLLKVFSGKGVLKICRKFIEEYPCRSSISIKLLCSFIEMALRCECFPVNFGHIFRTFFSKNTSKGLLGTVLKFTYDVIVITLCDPYSATTLCHEEQWLPTFSSQTDNRHQ